MNSSSTKPDRLLRFPEVQQITGYSRTTIWRLEQEDNFPKRRQIGPNAVGWLYSEVSHWLTALPRAEIGKQGAA